MQAKSVSGFDEGLVENGYKLLWDANILQFHGMKLTQGFGENSS